MKNLALVDRNASPQAPALPEQVLFALNEYIRQTDFKRLFNQIVAFQARGQVKSLAVLSQLPQEGKSFFVSALALAYARYLQSRVLIVDTVVQPTQRTLFLESILGQHYPEHVGGGRDYQPGLIDMISTKNFHGVSSESVDFEIGNYLRSVRDRYDVLLIDTCALEAPCADNVDPVILSKYVDTTILLTSRRSLESGSIARIKQELYQYQIPVLGAVFNNGVH